MPQRNWNEPGRQSAVALLIVLLKALRESLPLVLLLLASLFFGQNAPEKKFNRSVATLVGVGVGVTIISINKIISYFFTRFWVEGPYLIVTSGLWSRKRTEIPIAQITGLHRSQQWLHRITHTCRLRVETAGSDKTEWEADALTLADAEALDALLHGQMATAAGTARQNEAGADTLFRYQPSDVVKLALTENHLQSFLIIVFFILARLQDLKEYLGFDSVGYVQEQSSRLAATAQFIATLLAGGLLLALAFSFVRVFLKFFAFELKQRGGVYVLSRGLLHTIHKSMPAQKVQYLTWKSNWLRLQLRMYLLRLHALAESQTEEETRMELPVPNAALLHQLLHSYVAPQPAADGGATVFRVAPAFVYRRMLLYVAPAGIVAAVPLGWWYGLQAAWILLPLVYALIHMWVWQHTFRLYVNSRAVEMRRGVWGVQQLLVRCERIVSVSLRSSPWQRRHGYANLVLHLPGEKWTAPFLKRSDAEALVNFLVAAIETEGVLLNSNATS
ncbi:MAG: PH domain-containing protein [Lacibacter sp.]